VPLLSKLTDDQISVYLRKFPEWKHDHHSILKTFSFDRFADSIDFVNKVAEVAEAANHHPDILIRYNKVTITLTTYDKNGVTGKDFFLAEQIEKCYKRLLKNS
jgi:4a-hydroxytetrahydrobiopterin dehydratase